MAKMVSLANAFNPVYRVKRLKRRLTIRYPGVFFNLAADVEPEDAPVAGEIKEGLAALADGEDILSTTEKNWRGALRQRERIVWMADWSARHFPGDFVEIGAKYGLTTKLLAAAARRHQRRVIVVDPWEFGTQDVATGREFVAFQRNTSEFSDIIDVIRLSSLDRTAKEQLRKREICFSFVDGLHVFEACLSDILAVGHTKGIIGVDDLGVLNYQDADSGEIVDLREKLGPARHDENLRIAFRRGAYLINRTAFQHPYCREGYIAPIPG